MYVYVYIYRVSRNPTCRGKQDYRGTGCIFFCSIRPFYKKKNPFGNTYIGIYNIIKSLFVFNNPFLHFSTR